MQILDFVTPVIASPVAHSRHKVCCIKYDFKTSLLYADDCRTGYWMPFEAAKAVAATFCWKIRFVLTPLFGLDFPSMCIPPSDRARFGKMIIDEDTIVRVTACAKYYKMLQLRHQAGLSTEDLQVPVIRNACTPRPTSARNSHTGSDDDGIDQDDEKNEPSSGVDGSSTLSTSVLGNSCRELAPKSTPVRSRSTPSQEIWDFVQSRTRIPDSEEFGISWKMNIPSVSKTDGAANYLASPTELDSEDAVFSDHINEDGDYCSEDNESISSVSTMPERSSNKHIPKFQRRRNDSEFRNQPHALGQLWEELTAAETLLSLHTREMSAWNCDSPPSPPSTCASSPTSKRGIWSISFPTSWPAMEEGMAKGKKRRRASA